MNFIGPKYYVLETKTVEERVAQNDPHKLFLKRQVIRNMLHGD